jgi:succinyl-diaminopimelate desuccinylase
MSAEAAAAALPLSDAECVTLLRRLVAAPSMNPPGNEHACAEVLFDALVAAGVEARLDEFAPGRCNVVARLRGAGRQPALLLNGHLDTVPPGLRGWERDPLSAEVEDGRVWGLGAVDMKGGVAAIALAAIALARTGAALQGDLLIAATAGEEVDSVGAHRLVESGELADVGATVVAEPTAFAVHIAEKGALWLEVTVEGRTAHGSRPDLGVNAIERAHAVLARLLVHRFNVEPHPLLSPPTLSVNTITAGVKTNVIPDLCTITVDIRTVPPQHHDELVGELRRALGPEARVSVLNDRSPVTTSPDAPIVSAACAAVASVLGQEPHVRGQDAFTDASAFAALDVPQIILGPGRPEEAHCPNEGIEIADFLTGIAVFERLVRTNLAESEND